MFRAFDADRCTVAYVASDVFSIASSSYRVAARPPSVNNRFVFQFLLSLLPQFPNSHDVCKRFGRGYGITIDPVRNDGDCGGCVST